MNQQQRNKDAAGVAKKHQPVKAADEFDMGSSESEEDSDENQDVTSRTPSEADKLDQLKAAEKAKRLAVEKKQQQRAANDQNKMGIKDRIKEKRKKELEDSSMRSFLASSSDPSDESYRDNDLDKIDIRDIDTNRVKRKQNKVSMSQSQSMSHVEAGSNPNL